LPTAETNKEETRSDKDGYQPGKEVGQNQLDTDSPNVDILNPKTVCTIGCWNVCTLYQPGNIAQFILDMKNYSLQILGETRCGANNLATGHHIIFL
jgi:hypothetical protein